MFFHIWFLIVQQKGSPQFNGGHSTPEGKVAAQRTQSIAMNREDTRTRE